MRETPGKRNDTLNDTGIVSSNIIIILRITPLNDTKAWRVSRENVRNEVLKLCRQHLKSTDLNY